MFERFTERGKRTMVLAQNEARLLKHNFIGTEHLLLALLHGESGTPAQVLTSLGITLQAARDKVATTIGPTDLDTTLTPPFTPRAKKVLESALREALQLGHHNVHPEHVLLGLLRVPEGVAVQVITELGVTPDSVRKATVQHLGLGDAEASDLPSARPTEPMCPGCLSRLADCIRYRTVLVAPDRDTQGASLETVILYCGSCGVALPAWPH